MTDLESQGPVSGSEGGWDKKNSDTGVNDEDENVPKSSQHGELISIDKDAERALVWKFDTRILPLLSVMFLFNSLDKSNLGNAKTAGLEKDLGMAGTNQYNLVLSIFFAPFVLSAPVLGIIGKIYGPSRVLPCMEFVFGLVTLLVIVVKNFGGLLTIRIFLGLSEGAFFPLVTFYLTQIYRRGELARRLAIFYAAQSIAFAFGGLLAFGTFQIHSGPLASWRYLFLIEGALTCVVAIIAFMFLPYSAQYARFLTEKEKDLAAYRMQMDSSSVVNEKFVFREAIKILKHPTSWMVIVIGLCLGIPIQSVTLFLPQVVARLGYSTIKTNLYTVAPNVTGAIVLLILAFASDYAKLRFPFIAIGFLLTFVGYVIYAAIDVEHNLHVAYFATFLMASGISAPSVLLDSWYSNNIANESRRVVLLSVTIPLANLMGIVSSNVFRPQDAPSYIPALATTAAAGGLGMVLTLLLGFWMMADNKRRDRKLGHKLDVRSIPTEQLQDGPASENYRWFY